MVFLNKVLSDAKAYENATTDKQRALAFKDAKSYISHARTCRRIVSKSMKTGQGPVVIVTSQLQDVPLRLKVQLQLLKDKLVVLQATLDVQKQTMSRMQAAFWGHLPLLSLVSL
ncbi:hypothetical protein BDN72DRAFT_900739 [Pluteus cervinus]|uniref:Uncharacterized protein n=1 Tax=Pluteus cervinus TaxID=181527 RepID=A0ACD3AJL1_9AGAR|nr:hypothetical protein BDN72DRAFT_900739 [Pluteus cervinus]